jgi:hypothetical protein
LRFALRDAFFAGDLDWSWGINCEKLRAMLVTELATCVCLGVRYFLEWLQK